MRGDGLGRGVVGVLTRMGSSSLLSRVLSSSDLRTPADFARGRPEYTTIGLGMGFGFGGGSGSSGFRGSNGGLTQARPTSGLIFALGGDGGGGGAAAFGGDLFLRQWPSLTTLFLGDMASRTSASSLLTALGLRSTL